MKGMAIRTVSIRNTFAVVVGKLYAGDSVTGTVTNNVFYFTSVLRANGTAQTWPSGSNAQVSDGATIFLEVTDDNPPPPPPPPPPKPPVPFKLDVDGFQPFSGNLQPK